MGRRPRRAIVPAIGEEPVPEYRQRLVGRQVWAASRVDGRTLIEPTEARLAASSRSCVHQRGTNAGDVAGETKVRNPFSLALEIPGDAEARAPLRIPHDCRAALVLGAIEI